jgi:nucleotide-binding universal stress UspA family protein
MNSLIQSSFPTHLLLPLDGSRASDQAAPFAAEVAERAGIPVTVLHVFDSIRSLSKAAASEISWTDDAEPRAAIRPMASLRESFEALESRSTNVEVVGRVGSASQEIVKESELHDGCWIVIASLGQSGFRRLFLGSTARDVVRASRSPVLLTPSSEALRHFSKRDQGRAVAVFLDGSPAAERAVCDAAAAAALLEAELDLVRVAETRVDQRATKAPDEAHWENAAVRAVESYLKTVVERCASLPCSVNSVALAGSPEVQLPRYVEQRLPMIVALATRKRSGIERWTYGSFAERMVSSLSAPLLLSPIEEGN